MTGDPPFCLRVVTGTREHNAGYVQVDVEADTGSFTYGGDHGSGETVVDACYGTIMRFAPCRCRLFNFRSPTFSPMFAFRFICAHAHCWNSLDMNQCRYCRSRTSIQIRGTGTDAWTGSTDLSLDGGSNFFGLLCPSCTAGFGPGYISVESESNNSANQAGLYCGNGNICALSWPGIISHCVTFICYFLKPLYSIFTAHSTMKEVVRGMARGRGGEW